MCASLSLVSCGRTFLNEAFTHRKPGGTVGDIESAPFIHALSQLQRRVGKSNYAHIHVTYVPVVPYVHSNSTDQLETN